MILNTFKSFFTQNVFSLIFALTSRNFHFGLAKYFYYLKSRFRFGQTVVKQV